MKRPLLLSLLLFSISLPAFAAPVITAITPTSGPSAGGTEVTITGQNLLPTITCILPCPAAVSFGNDHVTVTSESATQLVVVTPPHEPGPVDVTVRVAGEEPVKLPAAFTFIEDADDRWEQILIPVYYDGTIEGALGSRWRTDVWLKNDSTEPIQVAPWPCPPNMACPPVFPLTRILLPGETLHNLPPYFRPPSSNPSRLLYVDKSNVSAHLRIADTSRETLNAGTEVPVVRERELRSGVTQLFNVPLNAKFRVMLRLYELAHTTGDFMIRVYDQSDLAGTAPVLYERSLAAETSERGEFRTAAAYTDLVVSDLLQFERTWPAVVRIEIEPRIPGSRYWAFASITNNETQLVTTSTPR